MYEIMIKADTLPEAYHMALRDLKYYGKKVPCPAYNTNRVEAGLRMQVRNPLEEPMISKIFVGTPEALEQYVMEILDGILDFEIERGNWKYTYHSRIAPQIPFVIETLKRDPNSTRAVITVRTDEDCDVDNANPACLQHIQYFIRDGELECSVLFRSNDAYEATFMNAFALIMLQKRIADELGVEVGSYTHTANSFHYYEKDALAMEHAYREICNKSVEDLTYYYVGDWDKDMAEDRPKILEKVEELKRRPIRNDKDENTCETAQIEIKTLY